MLTRSFAQRGLGRRHPRLTAALASILASAGLVACGSSSASTTPTLHFYLAQDNSGSIQQTINACNSQANGAYRIEYDLLPSSSDGQRQQLVRRLAAKDPALDIVGMDVTWAPEFAEAGWIREWTGAIKDQVSADTLPDALATASWQGKLYGAPSTSNTQLLWYRKDLVPTPPTTWDQMVSDAVALGQQGKPDKIEIQGARYEGLTVWFNTMVSSEGGKILSPDGTKVAIDQTTTAALTEIKKLADSAAADPSLSVQMEDTSRLAFEAGTAAFELNYPFVYPAAQKDVPKIFQNMGYAPFPRVDPNQPAAVTIGGINLGVTTSSKHPDLAFQAAACLRSAPNQKINATVGGLPPTIVSLYQDPDVRKSYPFADTILQELQSASIRPQTPAYVNVSLTIEDALSPPQAINPQAVTNKLKSGLKDAIQSKGLIP